MDCGCKNNKFKNDWPEKDDETGEKVFQKNDEDSLFDRIINRRKYDYSSDEEEDDFLLEDLNPNNKKDNNFLEQLKNKKHLLIKEYKEDKDERQLKYDTEKEEHIKYKLRSLK